ncbi:MAG: hypothetical protein HRU00_12845 [Myxococcales bacterium]|nr:hypothetical protein [Myxococcales bacterium]
MSFGISPVPKELPIVRGATFKTSITVKSDGVAIDLTGSTAQLIARPRGLRKEVFSLTETAGITLGGVAGTIDIALTIPQTTGLSPDDFPADYTLIVTYTDMTADAVLNGTATLVAGSIV